MKIILSVIISILSFNKLLAQGGYLKVKIGNDINLPIPFASIKVKNLSYGTISNSEGIFILKTDNINNTDSILISSIGYLTKSISLKDLIEYNGHEIKLNSSSQLLQEAKVVFNLNLDLKLKAAIEKTEASMVKEANFMSYLKESVSNNGVVLKFADASLYGYLKNSSKNCSSQIKIIESRAINKPENQQEYDYSRDAQPIIKISWMFNRYFNFKKLIDILDKKEKYNFYTANIDNNYTIIVMKPKETIQEYLYTIKTVISNNSGKVESIEYTVKEPQINYDKGIKIFSTSSQRKGTDIKLIYQNDSDVSFLKYANLKLRIAISNSHGKYDFVDQDELLISEVKTENVKEIPKKDRYTKWNLYRNGNSYNEDFWEKYNTILPSEYELKKINTLR